MGLKELKDTIKELKKSDTPDLLNQTALDWIKQTVEAIDNTSGFGQDDAKLWQEIKELLK